LNAGPCKSDRVLHGLINMVGVFHCLEALQMVLKN